MAGPDDDFVRWRSAADVAALARVYDTAAPALLRLALHHVRHPATAEDLVQSTFLAAIDGAARYDATRPLLGWLVGILLNQAKWLQRREGRAIEPQRLPDRMPDDPLAKAHAAEFTAQCDEAIANLPEVYRPVLRLHLAHEMTAAEIARALDRPPGTVRSQITRGLELLRAALPAGVALAAFAVLTPGPGLAAVRDVVLAAGTAKAAGVATLAAIATKTVVGAVAMKKTVIGGACALGLAAATWLLLLGPSDSGDRLPGVLPAPIAGAKGGNDTQGATAPSDAAGAARTRADAGTATVTWLLRGTVTTSAGEPASEAAVRVHVCYGGDPEELAEVRARPDGSYAVDLEPLRALAPIDLDRAALSVSALQTGHLRSETRLALPHRDPAQPVTLVQDLRLTLGAVVAGRVVDTHGSPVVGARVTLHPDAVTNDRIDATDSDARGRFRLSHAVACTGIVLAEHAAHGRAETSCGLEVGTDAALPDLVLQPRGRIRAHVVFADGEPAPGIAVGVYEPDDESTSVSHATTDRFGDLEVQTLVPGRYRLHVWSHGNVPQPSPIVTTDGDPTTIVLVGVHLLRFSWQDERGRALRPMTVGYKTWPADNQAAAAFAAGARWTTQLEAQAGSGAGSVRSLLLGSGMWIRVHAEHRDAHAEAMLEAAPPRNVIDTTLVLRESPRNATLRLRLGGADANAVGKVLIRLRQLFLGAPGSYDLEPESAGDELLVRWHPGTYRLELEPKETGTEFGWFAPFQQQVELRANDTTTLALALPIGGRVRLHLHVPDPASRAPVVGLRVATPAADDAPRRRRFIQTTKDGWVELGDPPPGVPLLWPPVLPPGGHALTVQSRDYREEVLGCVVSARAVTDVHVWLQPR
ncbi:MAG: sigma-70 family RNA polymerase sigma factor [Planctomycetota bacterium]